MTNPRDDLMALADEADQLVNMGVLNLPLLRSVKLMREMASALRLAASRPAPQVVDSEARHGAHLFATAKSLGWLDDGEGPLEFMIRRTREVAFEDAGKPVTSFPSRPAPVDREAVARALADRPWEEDYPHGSIGAFNAKDRKERDLAKADAILSLFRPAKAWDSATSPGMTDLMISPESLDAVGEPVAWRIRVRNGPHTYNEYTERLPFEPLVGSPVKVLGEPESLFTHPPAQPDTSAEEMRERCAAYHDALAENASGRIDDASTDTMRGLLRAVVQRHRSDAAAIRQLPTPERGDK